MPRSTRSLQAVAPILLVLALVTAPAMALTQAPTRAIPSSTAVMTIPEGIGPLGRPAVEFDHAAHTTALQAEGCTPCHVVEEVGLIPAYAPLRNVTDRDLWMDGAHEGCISCHRSRTAADGKRGPLVCAGCHVRNPAGVSQRAAMGWDYSLHGRHAQAFPDKCETCHHSYDQAAKKLVYVKGTEESCASCHLDRDDGKKLSLRNAAHTACVGCHLRRLAGQQTAGPTLCVGCHDAQVVGKYARLDPLPRLVRGQPDRSWIGAEGTRAGMVAFDHLDHEPRAGFCSGCHHQTLKPCLECHTLTGAVGGGMVALEDSYHRAGSKLSCVGCHAERARATECVGCHRAIAAGPGERTCVRCHLGPSRMVAGPDVPPPPPVVAPQLAPLPAASDAFPETVSIDVLARTYEPVKLPHLKIVARLDAGVRASPLATAFHATTERSCAGCHHHAPEGTFEPRCRACHGDTAAAVSDRPGLEVAYHRQCIGCHQAMGIDKQGCTDCHAAKEVQS